MRGTERCDEIVRLIDTALEVEAPVAPATAPPPGPPAVAPSVARRTPHVGLHLLRRLPHRPVRRDPRFVAPPAPAPSGPVRFAAGLRTAQELARRPFHDGTALPEAG